MKLKLYEFIMVACVNIACLLRVDFLNTQCFRWMMERMQSEAVSQMDNLVKKINERIDYLLEGKDLK